jgi:hypothetical protein
MPWLSRVNFIASDTLSFTDINNLGNDIRAWGDNVNGGGYTLSNVVVSAAGITASGSLGVGTSTPSWQATVYGTGQNTAALTDAGSKSASLFVGSSNGSTGAGGSVLFGGIVANGVTSHWAIKSLVTSTTANGTGDLAFVARAAAGDTSLTERMRITSGGNVGIGTASPAYQLQISTDSAAKPSTNTWTIASDARLKTVLGDYEKGLDAICALRPVRYEYNGLGGMPADGKEHISIVAQEAQEVFPECIGTFQGKLHEDDEEETELLNYNGHAVTFALINAVRELKARLDALV